MDITGKVITQPGKEVEEDGWIMEAPRPDPEGMSDVTVPVPSGFNGNGNAVDEKNKRHIFEKIFKNGKVGLHDETTNLTVLQPVYDAVNFLYEENILTVTLNKKSGLYAVDGKELLEPTYDTILPFMSRKTRTDVLRARNAGKWGLISFTGKVVVPAEYVNISEIPPCKNIFLVYQNGKAGLIDVNGKEIVKTIYSRIQSLGHGSLCVVTDENNNDRNRRYGMVDSSGNEILKTIYTNIVNFSDRFIVCTQPDSNYEKQFLVNKITGKIASEKYREIAFLQNNRARYVIYPNKQGFIDSMGKVVIKAAYSNLSYFNELGWNTFSLDNKWGIIDRDGKILIEPLYLKLERSYAKKLIYARKENKWGAFDYHGKLVIPFDFDMLQEDQAKDAIVFSLKGKKGVVDKTGKIVAQAVYDDISPMKDAFSIMIDKKWGVMSKSGRVVIPTKYERISRQWYSYKHGIISTELNGKKFFADSYGNEYLHDGRKMPSEEID